MLVSKKFADMKLLAALCPCVLLLVICAPQSLSDSPPLQDVCPMAPQSERKLFMNGFLCKHPSTIAASDFKTLLLNHAGDLNNLARSSVNMVTATDFPGLNTLGLSVARIDIAPGGAVVPHYHPRASEMMFVHGNNVVAGFFDTMGRRFQKTLGEGEVFVFPRGLVHYIMNYGFGMATTFSVLDSQSPGVASIAHAMFAPDSDVVEGLLSRMLKFGEIGVNSENSTSLGEPWTV
jgi:quercetin dioxygenase-like cupin family protein